MDLNQKVTAQMLREREIAIHGSKRYVIDTIMKMRTECGYDDFCFLGWFELGGFAPRRPRSRCRFSPRSDAGDCTNAAARSSCWHAGSI